MESIAHIEDWSAIPEERYRDARGAVDVAAYREALGPVAARIRESRGTAEATDIAERFLRDNASLLGTGAVATIREESDYLWSTFPERVKSLVKYQHVIEVLLRQVVDATWYAEYPHYRSDADVECDASLVSFTHSKEDFDVRFDHVRYHEHPVMRIPDTLRLWYRRATNHPGRYTQGITTTRCKRATAALINDVADAVASHIRPREPVRILVNSVLRTVGYQHALATWGYVAPRHSAHLAGYAVDFEKGWYERHDVEVHGALEAVIAELSESGAIYAVDEHTHWHVCLEPSRIADFERRYARWAR